MRFILGFKLALILSICISMNNQNTVDFSKDQLLGNIDYQKNSNYCKISSEYTEKSGIYMHCEAYEAFKNMYFEAKACGISLKIISAGRNFDYQKGIWERKWKDGKYIKYFGADRVKNIMKYSSMPGTSRHHWGTDIDLNSLSNSYFSKGEGMREYEWLCSHANSFGFYQTYTSKDSGRTGYEEEKWHWSYMPVAEKLLAAYNDSIQLEDISSFNGSEFAAELDVISVYVNGIDSALIK